MALSVDGQSGSIEKSLMYRVRSADTAGSSLRIYHGKNQTFDYILSYTIVCLVFHASMLDGLCERGELNHVSV